MNITIRNANIDDYEGLCLIYQELDDFHRINHPEIFVKPHDSVREKEYISEIISDGNKAIFVAELESEIIGFAECFIMESASFPVIKKRKWVQLDNIAVKQDYHSNQIRTLLYNKVIGWARDKGINRIELNVYLFNINAINFYINKGFGDLKKTMYLDLES